MAEGRWAEARKVLVGAAGEVRSPLINFLNAARAAHEMGDALERSSIATQVMSSIPMSGVVDHYTSPPRAPASPWRSPRRSSR